MRSLKRVVLVCRENIKHVFYPSAAYSILIAFHVVLFHNTTRETIVFIHKICNISFENVRLNERQGQHNSNTDLLISY